MTRPKKEVNQVAAKTSWWIALTADLLVALPLVFLTAAWPAGEIPTRERSVVALSSASALQHYQGFVDEPVGSWVEANATVGRVGGWRSYAQEVYHNEQAETGKQEAEHGANSSVRGEHQAPARETSP